MLGKNRVEWAARFMPVLNSIRKDFLTDQPFAGVSVAACMHVTAETANLVLTIRDGGALVSLCASNPLSTQDDVVELLSKESNISVFAVRGADSRLYYDNIRNALLCDPDIVIDDGADLITTIFNKRKDLIGKTVGGMEETTTGVLRLRNMERDGVLPFPIIAVNEAKTKHLFDNRYGTGQSALDGVIRATNMLIAGSKVVVSGYGWCGRGVVMRARGLGAEVIVTEVDPIKALEAVMDGYRVMPMSEASSIGNLFITVTGNEGIIRKEHFEKMNDRAIISNAGHFNVEVDISALEQMAVSKKEVRHLVMEYVLSNRKRLYVLGEGRLVNLACAEGHSPSVMDMSFANQALSAVYILEHGKGLERKVYSVPEAIDKHVARAKLESMGVGIDNLTLEQSTYLGSWSDGT